jgi:hypothetical protein
MRDVLAEDPFLLRDGLSTYTADYLHRPSYRRRRNVMDRSAPRTQNRTICIRSRQ